MKNKKVIAILGVVVVLVVGGIVAITVLKDNNEKVDVHVVDHAPSRTAETDDEETTETEEEEPEEEEEATEDPYADWEPSTEYEDQLDPDGGDFVIESESQNMIGNTERTGGVTREEYDRVNNTSEEDMKKSEEIFNSNEGGVPN